MITNPDRPLSPHLQIYNLPLSARVSIMHRMTGIILSGGMLIISALIISAAFHEGWFNTLMMYANTLIGRVVMLGWSAALFYHMLSGLRHLVMDTGALISHRGAAISGWLVILGSLFLTASTWYCVLAYR